MYRPFSLMAPLPPKGIEMHRPHNLQHIDTACTPAEAEKERIIAIHNLQKSLLRATAWQQAQAQAQEAESPRLLPVALQHIFTVS
jgi:hypothetical protein